MSPNEQFKVTGWSRTEPSISVITGLPISIGNRSSEGVVYQVSFHSCEYELVGLDLIRKRLECHHVGKGGHKGGVWQKLGLSRVKRGGRWPGRLIEWLRSGDPQGFASPSGGDYNHHGGCSNVTAALR